MGLGQCLLPRFLQSAKKSLHCSTSVQDNCHNMSQCDWTDCGLEVGLFDGAPSSLLNPEARKDLPHNKNQFVSLCTEHFELAVQNLTPAKARTGTNQPKALAIFVILGQYLNSLNQHVLKFCHSVNAQPPGASKTPQSRLD